MSESNGENEALQRAMGALEDLIKLKATSGRPTRFGEIKRLCDVGTQLHKAESVPRVQSMEDVKMDDMEDAEYGANFQNMMPVANMPLNRAQMIRGVHDYMQRNQQQRDAEVQNGLMNLAKLESDRAALAASQAQELASLLQIKGTLEAEAENHKTSETFETVPPLDKIKARITELSSRIVALSEPENPNALTAAGAQA